MQNRMVMSSVRTQVKQFNAAVEAGEGDQAKALYTKTVSKVDQAAAKGVIHKNAANRKKAQLATSLAKVQ